MADTHDILEHFSTDRLIQEIRERGDVIAVKVWQMQDLIQSEVYQYEEEGTELTDEELNELTKEMRDDAYELKPDLEDCRSEEWDAVDAFVKRHVEKILAKRNEEEERRRREAEEELVKPAAECIGDAAHMPHKGKEQSNE